MTSPFVDRVEYQVIGRDTNASKVFRDVATAADEAGSSVDGLGGHIDNLNRSIDNTSTRMRGLARDMQGISNVDFSKLTLGSIDTTGVERANRQLGDLVVEVDRAGQATVVFGGQLDGVTKSFNDMAGEVQGTAAQITTLGSSAATTGRDFDTLRGSVDGSRGSITGIDTDFRNLGRSIEDGRVVVIKFRDDLSSTVTGGRGQVDNLGTGFRNVGTEIETTRGRIAQLFRDVQRAGTIDIKEHIDIGRGVVETVSSDRDRLERAGLVAGGVVGVGIMTALSNVLTNGLGNIPIVGPLMEKIIGGIAEVSTALSAAVALVMSTVIVGVGITIGAAFGAALLAGLAGAGIAAGIAGQLTDSKVRDAFVQTAKVLRLALQEVTADFAPAIEEALTIVRTAVEDMKPQLKEFFGAAAEYVTPLTTAVMGFARNVLPGLTTAMSNSKPIIDQLAKSLPELALYIGDFFERISKVAPQLASALGYVIGAVEQVVLVIGIIIENLGKAFAYVAPILHGLGEIFDTVGSLVGKGLDWLSKVKPQAAQAAEGFHPLLAAKEYVAPLVDKTKELADATRDALNAANQFLGLGDAQSAMYDAMERGAARVGKASRDDLAEGIKFSSAAGRENWKVLRDIAASANAAASDITTMGGSAADAASVVQVARQKFMEVAGAMGIAAGDAQTLADKMFGIPDADPTATFHDKASAGIGGVDGKMNALDGKNAYPSAYLDDHASGGIANVKDALRRLNGATATVRVNASTPDGWNDFYGRASGGPIYGPGPKGVDSQLYMLAPGEHVLTAAEVDAAGGHHAIEAFRRSLLHKGNTAKATTIMDRPTGGGMDGPRFASALRQALSGMTLVIDDRTGRTAQLIARGG